MRPSGIAFTLLAPAFVAAATAAQRYDLDGTIDPPVRAHVELHGVSAPFAAASQSNVQGRFHFSSVLAGTYTVAIVQGATEIRQTVDVGPGSSDGKGHVRITVKAGDGAPTATIFSGNNLISARELTIPRSAYREYDTAQKRLAKRDTAGAVAHLKEAVRLAPQFAAAWNNLGTIACQGRDYSGAEFNFRKALDEDPQAFEPTVNLGGVLLMEKKLNEALKYNLMAVIQRPSDALANSQLGMTYFSMGDLDRSVTYLDAAKGIDPAHFSHPQLILAEIYLRKHEREAARHELEDFLVRHPDSAQAKRIRAAIVRLEN